MVSTNYYLHSTDFPESVHIGASAGYAWTTDTSIGRTIPAEGQPRGWTSTPALLVYLEALSWRELRFPAWVADEYGRVCTTAEATAIIRSHREHRELDHEFS
jgi:hypothetical protein